MRKKTEFEELTPGKSHLSDLKAYLHDSTRSSDKLFHSLNRYHVTRGKTGRPFYRPRQAVLPNRPDSYRRRQTQCPFFRRFYSVVYRDSIRRKFRGGIASPNKYPTNPISEKTPENRLIALFSTQRFEKDSPVHMLIRAGNETITDISLSEYLEQKRYRHRLS